MDYRIYVHFGKHGVGGLGYVVVRDFFELHSLNVLFSLGLTAIYKTIKVGLGPIPAAHFQSLTIIYFLSKNLLIWPFSILYIYLLLTMRKAVCCKVNGILLHQMPLLFIGWPFAWQKMGQWTCMHNPYASYNHNNYTNF